MGEPIQELRGTDNRGTADSKSGDKVVRGVILAMPRRQVSVINRSDYIDNAFTTIRWLPIPHTYVLEFDRGGKTRWVEVGADELGWTEKMQHPMQFKGWTTTTQVVMPYDAYDEFLGAYYASQEALGKAIKAGKAAGMTFVSFYRETPERGSVIVPTTYTRTTAPRLFWALHQLHEKKPIAMARREAYNWWGEVARMGANTVALNRIGLQMNEKGEYEPAFDPLDRLPRQPKVSGAKPIHYT